jgi:ribonuclease HII
VRQGKISQRVKQDGQRSASSSTRPSRLLAKLLAFDRSLGQGHTAIIGVDEVGRGCLAGPIVAAAVILPAIGPRTTLATRLSELNDSKQLTAEQRERLSQVIKEHAIWAIAEASVQEINEINILHASLKAMHRAVSHLCFSNLHECLLKPLVAVDGNKKIENLPYGQVPVVKGDGLSASIAAASVIAKVHRDKFMTDLAESVPVYDWHNNKGYGSKTHRQAIAKYGVHELHRRVFTAKLLADLAQLKLDLV